jgi:hypothetical protein
MYWASFSFGVEWIGPTYCMIRICRCMMELNLKKKSKQLEVNSNRRNVTHNVTQLQPAVTFLSEKLPNLKLTQTGEM